MKPNDIDPQTKALMEDKIKDLLEGNQGIQFNSGLPNSLCKKIELYQGDLLVEANGIAIKNASDYIKARNSRKDSIDMTFLRPSTHKLFDVHMNFLTQEVTQKIYG